MPYQTGKLWSHSGLREPDSSVEVFSILNMAAMFCVFFLLNSRFVLSPGMEIALPTGGESAYMETIGVITVQSEKFIMFNGNIFSLDTLELGIRKYLRKKNATNFAGNIVLLRPDKSLPVDALIKVCEIAKRAGYSGVQIASKPLVPR